MVRGRDFPFQDMMKKTAKKSQMLPAALLLVEWAALVVLVMKMPWLLPFAALLGMISLLLLSRPWTALLIAAATCGLAFLLTPAAALLEDGSLRVAVGMLVAGAALAFAGILSTVGGRSTPALARCLLRLVVLLHFTSGGALLAAHYFGMPLHGWLMRAHQVLLAACAADTLLCLLTRLYTPKRHWGQLRPPGAFLMFVWLGGEWRACLPEKHAAEDADAFSFHLADVWMWPVLRRSLPWLVTAIFFTTWACSSLHEVPAGHHGVREHLGTWEKTALEPGLHATLPWPLGRMHSVDTGRVREVVLGFRSDHGQPILWERAHYEGEQQSLVGSGDDFLSISVPVHFRVSDPLRYLRQIAAPEGLLQQEAQRVLLTLALPRSATQIMTQAREEMRMAMRHRLQSVLDAHESGLTITDVLLRDIHPPVSVAQTFQEVISALEEKEAFLHEAESYRRDSVSNSRATASSVLTAAQSAAANRGAQVQGQTVRFRSQLSAWAASPQLYQWREGYRVLDEALGGTKKAVFDHTTAARLPAHIDLRKVLNPDFVDSAPPAPQTLVPRAAKSLEAFDLEIEGYIRTDQGTIPAVDLRPPDADNLLKQQPAPAAPPAQKQP
jgi:regulator of protease activity HflC (stomatin/prohibitin superfamily)